MKKILLAMLILALTIFAMASCDNKDTNSSNDQTNDTGNVDSNPQATCEHKNIVDVVRKNADCTNPGYTEGKQCFDCGAVIEGMLVIPPFNHQGTITTTDAIEPTCQSAGRTAGKKCTECLKTIVPNEVIAKLEHTVVAKVDKAPTCTEPGSTGGLCCAVCFTDLSDEEHPTTIVPPTGDGNPCVPIDNPEKPAVAPTCSSTGLTAEKICANCGAVLEKQKLIPIDPTAHELKVTKEAKAATCTEKGCTIEQTCELCKNVITASTEIEINPNAHKLITTKEAKAATCTEKGCTIEQTCELCETVITASTEIEINPNAHTYVDGVCTGCSNPQPATPPADEE